MLRVVPSVVVAVLAAAFFAPPAFGQQLKVAELERKVAELERKVRDLESKLRDAERQRDDAKREKDRVQQAADAGSRTAAQQATALKGERDALALKANDLEGKLKAAPAKADVPKGVPPFDPKAAELDRQLMGEKADRARAERDRDEQKELVRQVLEIAKKELLERLSVKGDRNLVEQIQKADAKQFRELYLRLK